MENELYYYHISPELYPYMGTQCPSKVGNSCLKNAREADVNIKEIFNNLISYLGLNNIDIIASDTENACATYYDWGYPVIAYNPKFFRSILLINRYAVIAILLHEIAHIHYSHSGNWPTTSVYISHKQELEADAFAGYYLRYRSIGIDEGIQMFDHPIFSQESNSHPAKSKRIMSMRNGWAQADRELNPAKYEVSAIESLAKGAVVAMSFVALYKLGEAIFED